MNTRTNPLPIDIPRTNRVHTGRGITSLPAGKMVPIFAAGLHREDAIASGQMRFSFELQETVEVLMNAVRVDVKAYIVPMLAFDRFQGSMDMLNRSFEGMPPLESGGTVIPFIETMAGPAYKTNDILTYLGLHYRTGVQINTAYIEAYNQIWNYRATNRSKSLALRTRLQANLAPAFWNHEMFKHVVPDFDQAKADGNVALNVVNSKLPVTGISYKGSVTPASGLVGKETGGATKTYAKGMYTDAQNGWYLKLTDASTTAANAVPEIFAEMAQNGITVSLANIELAKKTQAFARLREQYAGHSDEFIVNILMDGIAVPDQALREPMLIGEASTIFGFGKRYATDGANLTKSVANGATFVDLNIRMPRLNTGGVLMIVAEVTPEQLFERQKDAFLHMSNNEADRPKFLRDYLDPEKVAVVPCEYVDLDHATPNATFGYAPMGYQWNVTAPHIGGRFYRPKVNAAFDEDRQRFWAVETVNPTLGPDFYLCTNIHTKPFAVTNQDIAEVVIQGDLIINGNTQFGPALIEASNDYAKVLAEVDQTRIVKP
ncbi:major capsid protein [Mesorhizobium comanense]|uniref:major capsid protein n=1 Tax=Mesorhizobium comanense TaxID=2502215 RepID=UPI0010FA2ED8|nr:major capsid protein [Mesorhizobium comanense]DAV95926.1 MAG TPA: Major capsid protein [Microviridae sp.]